MAILQLFETILVTVAKFEKVDLFSLLGSLQNHLTELKSSREKSGFRILPRFHLMIKMSKLSVRLTFDMIALSVTVVLFLLCALHCVKSYVLLKKLHGYVLVRQSALVASTFGNKAI